MTTLFQFRFEAGDGLSGHALGNLVLTVLTEVTGDFTRAAEIAARVVGARGRVVPATTDHVMLRAELDDGRHLDGETAIATARSAIRRLSLVPAARVFVLNLMTEPGRNAGLRCARHLEVVRDPSGSSSSTMPFNTAPVPAYLAARRKNPSSSRAVRRPRQRPAPGSIGARVQ
jgi:2-phospho-L-lactate transferase/gluconeogenesis factor (CofD/UPF0052 family)